MYVLKMFETNSFFIQNTNKLIDRWIRHSLNSVRQDSPMKIAVMSKPRPCKEKLEAGFSRNGFTSSLYFDKLFSGSGEVAVKATFLLVMRIIGAVFV